MSIGNLKKWAKHVGKALSIISVLFIAYSIYKLGFDFSTITDWKTFILIALFGVLLKIASVYLAASAWTDWLVLFSENNGFKKSEAIRAYSKANIGKYLPGNVMHYVERNIFASGLGLSQKRIVLASGLEIIGQLLSAVVVGLILAADYFYSAITAVFKGKNLIYAFAIGFFALAALVVLLVLKNKILSFIREFGTGAFIKTFLITLLKYILSLWLLGVVMVLLYIYMGGSMALKTFNIIVAAYVIAWVLGFVTPGASGGIGVRELVIVLLLKSVIGEEIILTLSVIHRLITIIGDFILYFIVIIKKKGRT